MSAVATKLAAAARAARNDPSALALTGLDRMAPGALLRLYRWNARRLGLDRVYLVLSFDCDTVDDANVVREVHRRVSDLGAKPAYAVPGEVLERGADVYRELAASGAEFLNHGHTEHVYFDRDHGRYASCFFYDELSPERVEQDIVDGDATVRRVLNVKPVGFRAPHFGTFQRPDELRRLHAVLGRLGYRYSSSTVPRYGVRYGPVFSRFGLAEVPVSGRVSSPLSVLDTWGCFAAPDRTLTPDDYEREAVAMAGALAAGGAGVINYYGDPIHVHGSDLFFQTIGRLLDVAEPVTFTELLDRVG